MTEKSMRRVDGGGTERRSSESGGSVADLERNRAHLGGVSEGDLESDLTEQKTLTQRGGGGEKD